MTPELSDRLSTDRSLWLTTLRADGSPHVTPVWFVHTLDATDGTFWIGCGTDSVKVRNVRRDPRVSLALEDAGAPVVAEGAVEVVETGFDPGVVAEFAAKYGWDVTLPERVGQVRALLRVPVSRWLLSGTAP